MVEQVPHWVVGDIDCCTPTYLLTADYDYNIINHINMFCTINLILGDSNGYETDQHNY
jgi:hypothetical protein